MNIIYCADFLPPAFVGGSARYAYDLALGLCALGVDLIVITRAAPAGTDVSRLNGELKALIGPANYREVKDSLTLLRAVRDVPKDAILVSHHPVMGLALQLLLPRNRSALVFHGPYHEEYKAGAGTKAVNFVYQLKRLAQLLSLRLSSEVFVLSGYMAGIATQLAPTRKRIHLLGPIFNPNHSAANVSANAAPKGGKHRLITVRRLTARMGVLELLEWFATLDRDAYELHIVGTGPLESEIRHKAGGRPNVFVHGFLDDSRMYALLGACDLFVLPSKDLEGFGLVILEAFSVGVTVIATDRSGGGADFIRQVDPQFVFSFERAQSDFRSAVEYALGQNVREQLISVSARYSPIESATKLLSFLQ